jgi:phosphoribosylaminoimidazole-succinocarboxamide synthase
MGSVKDLEVVKKPTKEKMGVGRFIFSDRYSVFDWGEMPDHIRRKGEALCMMGAYCFEKLEEKDIKSHYRGLVDKNGEAVRLAGLQKPSNVMEIDLVNVIMPKATTRHGKLEYDYRMFTPKLKNCLIPLEIIYRNGLPEGSSVFKRLEQGSITIKDLDLDHYPKAGERLSRPVFDVSTKLEEKDRYVTWERAKEIAGLTDREAGDVKALLLKVDGMISQLASKAGLENEDGKIELAFDHKRSLMVADVVGTLDECRFTYGGLHVSKEIARQFYRKTKWYNDVDEAKKIAETRGVEDWKGLCQPQPPKLEPRLAEIISEMYMATANEITDHRVFDVPRLAEVVEKYREYAGAIG